MRLWPQLKAERRCPGAITTYPKETDNYILLCTFGDAKRRFIVAGTMVLLAVIPHHIYF